MPDLGEDDKLTKDGVFYTANNKNKLEPDNEVRTGVNAADKPAPDIPFGETGSKGKNEGSDSTKPGVAENVEKVVDKLKGN